MKIERYILVTNISNHQLILSALKLQGFVDFLAPCLFHDLCPIYLLVKQLK